jgi:hypothetical protein
MADLRDTACANSRWHGFGRRLPAGKMSSLWNRYRPRYKRSGIIWKRRCRLGGWKAKLGAKASYQLESLGSWTG